MADDRHSRYSSSSDSSHNWVSNRIDIVKAKELPDVDYLKECFELLENGSLRWKVRPQNHFSKKNYTYKIWNKRYAGNIADIDMQTGYCSVCVNGIRYKSHRVVFAIANGDIDCLLQIDHINGNSKDNRPSNLRLATSSQNAMNFRGVRKDNTHGARGVSWNVGNKKWESYFNLNGIRKYIGLFKIKQDAINASAQKRKELFGEFWESQNGVTSE